MTGTTSHRKAPTASLLARYPFLPALGILILLFALNGLAEPNALSYRAVRGLISTYLALMLLAVAQSFVVFAADIDLSVGAILSLVNVSVVMLMQTLGGGPAMVILSCGLGLLIYLLARTRLVTQLLAVGDDQQSAFQSGLPVTWIRIKGYALCGVFSALAALCISGDTASGDPLVGGAMTLYSVAAVVLGGTALSGGTGSALGSVFGALIIGLISSLVFFAGTPSQWQNLVQGLTILLALMAGILVSRRVRR